MFAVQRGVLASPAKTPRCTGIGIFFGVHGGEWGREVTPRLLVNGGASGAAGGFSFTLSQWVTVTPPDFKELSPQTVSNDQNSEEITQ